MTIPVFRVLVIAVRLLACATGHDASAERLQFREARLEIRLLTRLLCSRLLRFRRVRATRGTAVAEGAKFVIRGQSSGNGRDLCVYCSQRGKRPLQLAHLSRHLYGKLRVNRLLISAALTQHTK